MYVTFDSEPGRYHYDYSSTNWGNIVDQITIRPDMAHFCTSCMINIAVYGYHSGHYSISASANGITMLQSGITASGHVEQGEYKYYTAFNGDEFGVLGFRLNVWNGDADIYITKLEKSGSLVLPTVQSNTWHASYFGDDSIVIDYTDEKFCVTCDYIVGIYGYRNATYSLLFTENEDSVVRLIPNRIQTMNLKSQGSIQYFSVALDSSSEDVTFSLTPLDSGYADMYVQQYNESTYSALLANDAVVYPVPSLPWTYFGNI